jgi:chemotaxis response regulator CheB
MPRNLRRTNRKPLPIVGIGASTDGLEALRQMLETVFNAVNHDHGKHRWELRGL